MALATPGLSAATARATDATLAAVVSRFVALHAEPGRDGWGDFFSGAGPEDNRSAAEVGPSSATKPAACTSTVPAGPPCRGELQ